MAMALSHSASSARGSVPRLGASATIKYYRRSTTNKAPRKRTFLVLMTKFDAALAAPAGVPKAFANSSSMLTGGKCFQDIPEAYDGGSGNDGRGNANNGRGGSDNNDNNSNGPQPLATLLSQLSQALLGAMVLTAAVAAFPGHSQATTSQSPSASSHSAAARPRSKVLHVSCKGGTLVVPLPAGGDVKAAAPLPRSGPFARTKVVEAPIELSGPEAAFINQRQYFVRESMRV